MNSVLHLSSSFFQLSIASWLILDSTFIRAIHLGFALLIVFLNYPLFKKTRFGLKYFSAKDRIPILDYLIGIIAAFAAVYIVIDYAGLITRYGHLSKTVVQVGQMVKVGQVVGKMGSTGRSTGPHLHYETRVDGDAVDPQRFLRAGLRMGAL